MTRLYPDFTYGEGPRAECWWDETCNAHDYPTLKGAQKCDVAIIGGGFTGISAALHLARSGVSVALLEANRIGWGASGRNGGFCCLGGGMLEDAAIDRAFGREARLDWRATELAAIQCVEERIADLDLDVDRHSHGETQVAHRERDYARMERDLASYAENYGLEAKLTPKSELADEGMRANFHGAMTVPAGFALNPLKYLIGIASAATYAGAKLFNRSTVKHVRRGSKAFHLEMSGGDLTASKVIVATNGYSSEDLPAWLAGRYLPTQSSIIVTRPLTPTELQAQGWTTAQAVYDTRHLLHYFRLMPDNRMLFGLRGGILSSPAAEKRAFRRARRDFNRMFPAWRSVETTHAWSGLVCIARNRMPFVGEIPDAPGIFTSLCYHGNGVAMASYCGALLSELVQDRTPRYIYPEVVQRPLAKFELGRRRRWLQPAAYLGFALSDL
ncbi:MAG: FAD-dependent oxidoreductase [Pseudomonadota bacterium]